MTIFNNGRDSALTFGVTEHLLQAISFFLHIVVLNLIALLAVVLTGGLGVRSSFLPENHYLLLNHLSPPNFVLGSFELLLTYYRIASAQHKCAGGSATSVFAF
jgi:hypothetical protein